MRPFCGRLRLSRVCEVMMVLAIIVNLTYVLYYRLFLFEANKESRDKPTDRAIRDQLADVRVFNAGSASRATTAGPVGVVDVGSQQTGDITSQTGDNTKQTGDNTKQTGDQAKQTGDQAKQTGDHTKQTGDNTTQPCPDESPFLIGDLACDCGKISLDKLIAAYQHVEPGGRLLPDDCKPAHRTAIIVPFRDRHEHLSILLNMLLPILQRQQADITFFVIEQTKHSPFNRAALLNIGFLEALKTASFDCIIFHDVDLIPLSDHNMYRCGPNIRQLVARIKMSQGNTIQTKDNYTGGVLAFTPSLYQAINGHSNLFFGWGGEDEDLYHRIVKKNLTIYRSALYAATYQMLNHTETELKNPQRFEILKSSTQRQDVEGLNTCKYTVNHVSNDPLFTWINVSLNVTEVLKTAPDKVLQDMKAYLKSRKARSITNSTRIRSSVRSSSSSPLPPPPPSPSS